MVEITRQVKKRCIISGLPADTHHLKSRGSDITAKDIKENLIPLARPYHNEIHNKGIVYMANKYHQVRNYLIQNGWVYESREDNGFKERWINYEIWNKI